MKLISSFFSNEMTTSPRRLNAAQYDENFQNWPKWTFQWPVTANFSRILKKKTDTIFEISIPNCIRINVGSKSLKQKVKKGHHNVYVVGIG